MWKHTVSVWGKDYEVHTYHPNKTVWEAVGDYRGETIRVKGRSQTQAIMLWRRTAEYRGNG